MAETLQDKIRKYLYEAVLEGFGHGEADDPCYDLDYLAEYIAT